MKNILYQESIVEIKHLFRMMKNTLLALFVFAGTAFATESYSQTMKVTVVADNVSTGKVISEIEKQTDYLFVYNVNEAYTSALRLNPKDDATRYNLELCKRQQKNQQNQKNQNQQDKDKKDKNGKDKKNDKHQIQYQN